MKNINFILVTLLFFLFITGCSKDFLERPPQDKLTVENFYTSAKSLKAGTAPLYCKVWFDFNSRPSYVIGDIRAGNCLSPWGYPQFSKFTISTTDDQLQSAWNSYYVVINQASTIYNNIIKYSTGVSEIDKKAALSECRFMRATAYFYLVRLWGAVPIIEDNQELVNNPKVPLRPVEDVYEYIIRDLKYASKNLWISPEKGRVSAWAAKGMLAKVYLARSGYGSTDGNRKQQDLDSSIYYSAQVCHKFPSGLLTNYEDLFKYKFNNNQESLFALQWVPLGDWGTQNATLSDFAYSTDLTGPGVNAWSSTTASYDILRTYERMDTIRRNATFLTDWTFYPYINISGGGYRYKAFRSNDTASSAHFKKYVPGWPKDENGGFVATMSSPLNTYMLRLADIYLTYAEASLGNNVSLNSGDAFEYFNKVRDRAQIKRRSSITMDSIIYERRIELAMEGQAWYDMVRWFYFMPGKILDIINTQHREASYKYVKNTDGSIDVKLGTDPDDAVTNVAADKIILPIPEQEAIANPLLMGEPVPYTFTEE